MSASVIALIATIPARKRSCERLLDELTRQTRKPDAVLLVLDGYTEKFASAWPASPLPGAATYRIDPAKGAGNRWLCALDFMDSCAKHDPGKSAVENLEVTGYLPSSYPLRSDDIIVCLDDDIMLIEAPRLVEALVTAVDGGPREHGLEGRAAAAMGRTFDGKPAPPGDFSRGQLMHAAGCGLTVSARHLVGLQAFADEIKAAGGPDALGLLGDDDALVSAYLWKQGIPIVHAATGNIYPAPNTQASSHTEALRKRGQDPDAQKRAIRKATGWPWAATQ